jgi:hypothetical protein
LVRRLVEFGCRGQPQAAASHNSKPGCWRAATR